MKISNFLKTNANQGVKLIRHSYCPTCTVPLSMQSKQGFSDTVSFSASIRLDKNSSLPESKDSDICNSDLIEIKNDLHDAIEDNDAKTIFKYFGMLAQEDEKGFLTLKKFRQPAFFFSDCGIDENALFEKVKYIEGNANFADSQITDLTNLESIGGNANFAFSRIRSLGNLESIGGNANFKWSLLLKNLGNLETIGRNANFAFSRIRSLGNLESIGRNANFAFSRIRSLGNLESIGKNADFSNSQIVNLGNLESIGGDVDFADSRITSLGNLKSIGGNANFADSQITNLANLKSIGGNTGFAILKLQTLIFLKQLADKWLILD